MSQDIPPSKIRRGRGPATSHQITPSRNPGSADPADPDCPGSSPEGTGTLDEARLRLLFFMKLRGLTQVEIARRFDVTERTIRNWEKLLPNLKLPVLENMNPNQEVAHPDRSGMTRDHVLNNPPLFFTYSAMCLRLRITCPKTPAELCHNSRRR